MIRQVRLSKLLQKLGAQVSDILISDADDAIDVVLLRETNVEEWLSSAPDTARKWVEAHEFKAAVGKHLVVPDESGSPVFVLVGVGDPMSPWDTGGLARSLPGGCYRLGSPIADINIAMASLGWMLGAYEFDRYKKGAKPSAKLVAPDVQGVDRMSAIARATTLVRDLINTPASDLGPAALADAANSLAERHGGEISVIVGSGLLDKNYPAVHAVGRAATDEPRMIEITWGHEGDPVVALVGKGVCFDSGGLDIKTAGGMKLMKKDMGGAAHVLGIADVIMSLGLKVRLKVLVPAVENAISGNAMRPLDVVQTRAGITVEIGNTDAEGRVILADALCRAGEAKPDLILDFATLTGAARVALGTELPALFCNDEALAADILNSGDDEVDSLWRLPLWPGYRKMIEGKVADITNAPDGGYAGAITAALFLERFVPPTVPWAHVDVMAWNISSKPGRPEGGEAMGLRAMVSMLEKRYG